MNFGKIRDDALRLIGRYTNAGTLYALSYNNQADYVNKVASSINSCLLELASSVRKLPAVATLCYDDGEEYGVYRRHVLPEDCLEIRSGGLLNTNPKPGESRYVTTYFPQMPDHILIPKYITSDLILEYFRRPQLLPDGPADTAPIDADVDAQSAIPYYVASELLMEDDPYRSESLKMRFEDKIERLSPRVYTTVEPVFDAYGLDVVGDGYGV